LHTLILPSFPTRRSSDLLLRYDGRLNGLSDTACENASFETFVSDLECVIEASGLDRFVLLGISQGCSLSVEYATRHPEKVAGLVDRKSTRLNSSHLGISY